MNRPLIKVKDVKVGDRVRKDYGKIENLAVSIRQFGLLHPIVIDENNNLIAGERRLLAHQEIGKEEIEYVQLKDIDDMTKREIELEENIKRKDFTWQEEVDAKDKLDKLKREKYGSAVKGHGRGWGLVQTAMALQQSVGGVSQDLKLAEALKVYPELGKEKNKTLAWKRYQQLMEGEIKGEMASRIKVEVKDDCLILGKAEIEMKKIKEESIDLIITDPPWGIDILKSAEGKFWKDRHINGEFEDSKHSTLDMLNLVFKECYRVLKKDSHCYVFFGIQMYKEIGNLLTEVGFYIEPVPLIWNKRSGGQAGTDFHFPIAYECIFFCMKGKRKLNGTKADMFEVERVPSAQKIHPTEKPKRLIRQFVELSSDIGEIVLDPFCGSGVVLISAFECGREGKGVESNEKHYNSALVRIKAFKEDL